MLCKSSNDKHIKYCVLKVCCSGAVRSFDFSVSLAMSPQQLWQDWERNLIQLHHIYAFYADCADKSLDVLHGKILSHGRGGTNK